MFERITRTPNSLGAAARRSVGQPYRSAGVTHKSLIDVTDLAPSPTTGSHSRDGDPGILQCRKKINRARDVSIMTLAQGTANMVAGLVAAAGLRYLGGYPGLYQACAVACIIGAVLALTIRSSR